MGVRKPCERQSGENAGGGGGGSGGVGGGGDARRETINKVGRGIGQKGGRRGRRGGKHPIRRTPDRRTDVWKASLSPPQCELSTSAEHLQTHPAVPPCKPSPAPLPHSPPPPVQPRPYAHTQRIHCAYLEALFWKRQCGALGLVMSSACARTRVCV